MLMVRSHIFNVLRFLIKMWCPIEIYPTTILWNFKSWNDAAIHDKKNKPIWLLL